MCEAQLSMEERQEKTKEGIGKLTQNRERNGERYVGLRGRYFMDFWMEFYHLTADSPYFLFPFPRHPEFV